MKPKKKLILRFALLLGTILALTSCNKDTASAPVVSAPAANFPDYWPTAGWQSDAPESHGFTMGAFDTLAVDAAAAMPYYTSLLVIKDGWLLHESYHTTASEPTSDASTLHNVWSVAKSVSSMTVGVAWTQGAINNLDVTTGDMFPQFMTDFAADDPRRNIRLRDALQMRSGYQWNDAWLFTLKNPMFAPSADCNSDDTVTLCSILRQTQTAAPGTVWNYNTMDSYLVSAFFNSLTGQVLGQYAATHLFAPLGISADTQWGAWPDTSNYTFGGGLLGIRSTDLAKLGMLMLYDGQWDGKQLIAKDWIDSSLAPIGIGLVTTYDSMGDPSGTSSSDIRYGMQWWRKTGPGMEGLDAISARGLGGQQMHVFKDKGLIVLITCDSDDLTGPRSAAINAFMQSRIISQLVH